MVDLRVEEGIHQLFCIAGQRRLLAAREAGKSKANCLIKQFSDPADRIASGLAENLTREDLHCLDIAEGFAGLMANGWSEEQIASQFERNPRTIRRYLTIAGWPENVLKLIRKNQDTFTTKLLFNELVSHKYDSEEELIKVIQSKIKSDLPLMQTVRVTKPNSVKLFEKQLKSKIQMRVSVKGNEQEGKLTISYSSMDELQKIKDMLLPVNE